MAEIRRDGDQDHLRIRPGGTSFVVKPEIRSAQDLRGKTVADPGLGGNHDVLLRSWLKDNGLQTNKQGGGDVFIKPTKPESAIVQEFSANQIAGAVESAPYDVQLVQAGGVRFWPDLGTITILVVRQDFLAAHPDAVAGLLRGQIEADELIHNDASAAKQSANDTLASSVGRAWTPTCWMRRFRRPPSPTTPMPHRSTSWRVSRFRSGYSTRST